MKRSFWPSARRTIFAASSTGLALLAWPRPANAQQIDVNPPLPNVMLLIDNSGSMERMIDGTLPESNPATACNCDATSGTCNWNAAPPPNRWGILLQALTGTFQNGYNCAAMPRTPGSVFANEYKIGGVNPYDTNYYIPFHRPIVKDTITTPLNALSCVYAPGALPGAATPNGVGPLGTGAPGLATDFPATAIVQHTYGTTLTSPCVFSQNQDGALDAELDILRLGLMTFDQDLNGQTGVTGSTPNLAVANPSFTGMWSYFPNWNSGGACTYYGAPASCATQSLYAVGARNPAAPPWEGRMMPLPSLTASNLLGAQEQTNAQIQQVLLSSRPYGATPLAGMFVGAKYYFQSDPTGPQQTDPYVQGGCRNQYIILLTDGAPNLDLRPDCSAAGSPAGVCPFPLPEDTATALETPLAGTAPVLTYVIGFAVSSFQDQGQTIYCSNLVANGQVSATCSDPTKQALYGPCCELQKIAVAGGTGQAFFADTPGDLQTALGNILSQIAKNTTTRTTPAYSPVILNTQTSPNQPQTNTELFLASFNPTPGAPWSGDLQRQRFVCSYLGGPSSSGGVGATYSVAAPPPTVTAGDDFASNLNSHAGPARNFIALEPDPLPSSSVGDSTATIRPYVNNNVGDGLGRYSATTAAGPASTVINAITPDALNLQNSPCTYNSTTGSGTKTLTPAQCRDMLLDFAFGQQSFTDVGDYPFVSRFNNSFGDIFHATPVVVGPPSSLLQDDSYIGFRSAPNVANRLQVVYAVTNDGLLHAFWADENKQENNELWAMMPPAVMSSLNASYPAMSKSLLDGSPVAKDVVFDRPISNLGNATNWHTMLVAGFGPLHQGYYAVDVTIPDKSQLQSMNGSVPQQSPPIGPVFRWQLTSMPATNAQLFGAQSGTPVITSLFVDPGDGGGAREIGVAILPGGQDGSPTSSATGGPPCARANKPTDASPVSPPYPWRSAVQCWGTNQLATDPVVGRSLSVVRLDTGEILRVFMRLADASGHPQDTLVLKNRITDTPLDSPMTGVPVVFPSDVGSDATKVFVGDADGTVWRFDLSNSDPSKWTGEIFLDLYNTVVDQSGATAWSDGQPVEISPVVSLDPAGNVVLSVASGSPETFNSTGTYYVYSVSDVIQGSPQKFHAKVNWWLDPAKISGKAGERVSGPMTVFDGVLYFATYASPPQGGQSCTSGDARLWGRDFVTPKSTDLSLGGMPRMQPLAGQSQGSTLPDFVQPDQLDTTLAGVVIPGVSIKATPACAGLSTPGQDSYVAGATHSSPQGFSPGGYSLFSQVGAKGSSGLATRQLDVQLPTPVAPTRIDSWAAVVE